MLYIGKNEHVCWEINAVEYHYVLLSRDAATAVKHVFSFVSGYFLKLILSEKGVNLTKSRPLKCFVRHSWYGNDKVLNVFTVSFRNWSSLQRQDLYVDQDICWARVGQQIQSGWWVVLNVTDSSLNNSAWKRVDVQDEHRGHGTQSPNSRQGGGLRSASAGSQARPDGRRVRLRVRACMRAAQQEASRSLFVPLTFCITHHLEMHAFLKTKSQHLSQTFVFSFALPVNLLPGQSRQAYHLLTSWWFTHNCFLHAMGQDRITGHQERRI